MTRKQLIGLVEVLPAEYPRQCGPIVLSDRKGHSRNVKRRHGSKKPELVPWYQRFPH